MPAAARSSSRSGETGARPAQHETTGATAPRSCPRPVPNACTLAMNAVANASASAIRSFTSVASVSRSPSTASTRPTRRTPVIGQDPQVEVGRAPARHGREGVVQHRRVDVPHHAGEVTHVAPPIHLVGAPGPARYPAPTAHRQPGRASGARQLVGDLAAGLAAAHDQHAPRRQHPRGAVGVRGQLRDACRQRPGERRHHRLPEGPGRHHDRACPHRARGRLHPEARAAVPVRVGSHADDAHTGLHGRREGRGIALQVRHEVSGGRERVRIRPHRAAARQLVEMVR